MQLKRDRKRKPKYGKKKTYNVHQEEVADLTLSGKGIGAVMKDIPLQEKTCNVQWKEETKASSHQFFLAIGKLSNAEVISELHNHHRNKKNPHTIT